MTKCEELLIGFIATAVARLRMRCMYGQGCTDCRTHRLVEDAFHSLVLGDHRRERLGLTNLVSIRDWLRAIRD